MNLKLLGLAAITLLSTQANAAALNGKVAKFSCDFGGDFDGIQTYTINLATAKVQGPAYERWDLRGSIQKGFGGRNAKKKMRHFDLGKAEQPIRILTLDGDNQDDTDYLLTISYQPACAFIIFEAGKNPSCDQGNVVATMTIYPDSDLENTETITTKKCTMEILK